MSHTGYSGDISPAVWLHFKGGKTSGAHSSADDSFLYNIANECVHEWDITCNTGARVHHLVRRASGSRRFFSDSLNTYLSSNVTGTVIDEIIDAHLARTLTITVTLKLWYHSFFHRILTWVSRTSADSHNLGDPDSAADILGTFTRRGSTTRYSTEQKEIRDIPSVLSGYTITPSSTGRGPPRVKLYIYLRVKEALSSAQTNDVTKALVAADYTKINRFGIDRDDAWYNSPATVSTIERCLEVWEKNTWQFFINYLDMSRGTRLRDEIVSAARAVATGGGSQAAIVRKVRDQIDKLLITANHWGQRREDRTTESYQYQMSNVFGSIHQSRWRASPVAIYRTLEEDKSLDFWERVAFILQLGAGHCGEHSTASFGVLIRLIDGGLGGTLVCAVKSGNSNIDHAFVIGGIRPRGVISTTIRNPRNGGGAVGDSIEVWDLRAALSAVSSSVDGFVCDPYLDPSQIQQTARGLLAGLNSSSKRARGLDTDAVWFGNVWPDTPALPTSSAPSVRNV